MTTTHNRACPQSVEVIAIAAQEAMLMEVACTPAPGLVDRKNGGAHRDMDIFTFLKSSSALGPSMLRCAAAGHSHVGCLAMLLPTLRRIGRDAERAMFAATEGVNTQKGLIFLLGVLSAAAAFVDRKLTAPQAADICAAAAEICEGLVERELKPLREAAGEKKLTAGERLYLRYHVAGIRGEMEAGLPSVAKIGLPAYQAAIEAGLPLNDALVETLLALMTVTQDTTILHRHGPETLRQVQREAADILAAGGMRTMRGRSLILKLDRQYIRQNISPGGSADLLAAVYFLWVIEQRLAGV